MSKVLLDKAKCTANRLYNNFKVLQKFTKENYVPILIDLHDFKNVTVKRMLADKFIEAGIYEEDERNVLTNVTHIVIVNGNVYAHDGLIAEYNARFTTEIPLSILLDMDFDENMTFTSFG